MKIRILYHEVKEKEFRSKKTLKNFLKIRLDSEILRVIEMKDRIGYMREIKKFLMEER